MWNNSTEPLQSLKTNPIIISNLNFSKQHSLHPTRPIRLICPTCLTRPTRLPPLAILRDSLSLSLLPSYRYTLPKFLACAARTPITALAARTILPRKLANSQIITTFAPENSK